MTPQQTITAALAKIEAAIAEIRAILPADKAEPQPVPVSPAEPAAPANLDDDKIDLTPTPAAIRQQIRDYYVKNSGIPGLKQAFKDIIVEVAGKDGTLTTCPDDKVWSIWEKVVLWIKNGGGQ